VISDPRGGINVEFDCYFGVYLFFLILKLVTLLTFWPPGPLDLENSNSNKCFGMSKRRENFLNISIG
jgi:hypothetical protein